MSKTVKLRKGLDIRLIGEADKVKADLKLPSSISLKPADFHGLTPKMVVKSGDKVQAGSVIFYDKYNDAVKYVSPVSGEITDIVRGEKRRILEVRISCDSTVDFIVNQPTDVNHSSKEDVKNALLNFFSEPLSSHPL